MLCEYWDRNVLSSRPTASERLRNPDALLSARICASSSLERRAVDAVFREPPVVALPATRGPWCAWGDYLELVERSPTTAGACAETGAPSRAAATSGCVPGIVKLSLTPDPRLPRC